MAEIADPFQDDEASKLAEPEIYMLDDAGNPIDQNGKPLSIEKKDDSNEVKEDEDVAILDDVEVAISDNKVIVEKGDAYTRAQVDLLNELENDLLGEQARVASREEGYNQANKIIESELDSEQIKLADAAKIKIEAEEAAKRLAKETEEAKEIAKREQFLKENPLFANAFDSNAKSEEPVPAPSSEKKPVSEVISNEPEKVAAVTDVNPPKSEMGGVKPVTAEAIKPEMPKVEPIVDKGWQPKPTKDKVVIAEGENADDPLDGL